MISRRSFLWTAPVPFATAQPGARPKIALVVTEYRRNAHADVIGTRLLAGYDYNGERRRPRVDVASLFTDQIPPQGDLSRPMAKKFGVPLFDTVREALTLGGNRLAVDGVVLIGEHGRYPYNEKGQHLYPRYELFSQVVDLFHLSGQSAPVFCDKHLSTDWNKAKQMVEWSRQLRFPFLAGSSVPITWRRPPLEIPLGARLRYAVAAAYGGDEAYGYHAMESLQAMVERRHGGETGVASVQAFNGQRVWQWTDANAWAAPLLRAALARSDTRKAGDVRSNARQPTVFHLRYQDGLQAAIYMLDGHVSDFTFAADVEGEPAPLSTLFWLQPARPFAHFSTLVYYIEELMLTRRAAYPVERTLLVTGALAACMESAWRGGVRIETPYLKVPYSAPPESLFNRGPVPPEKEDI